MSFNMFLDDTIVNKEDIDNQRNFFVVEHNDLITKAKHDLTAKELKIMDFVISKIKPNDIKFHTVYTSFYELNKVMGLNIRSGANYNQMAKALQDLMKKLVHIYYKDAKQVVVTHWLQTLIIKNNGKVELELSQNLMPFLLELKSNYTQYYLRDTVQLDSKYSILIYKMIREADKFRGKKTPYIRVEKEEFVELLGSPKSYTFGQFNQNVLKPSINEINSKITDMKLKVNQIKEGRKVIELEIYNMYYPRLKDESDSIPLENWL